MVVTQLEKNLDVIWEHRGEALYFIKEADSEKTETRKRRAPRRVASSYVWSIAIEDFKKFIDDDKYALISITY